MRSPTVPPTSSCSGRREGLGHGVDGVGAHRVAHVDVDVHHHHALRRVEHPRSSRSRQPPPRSTMRGIDASPVASSDLRCAHGTRRGAPRRARRRTAPGRSSPRAWPRRGSPRGADHARGVARRGDHRGLLDGHGDDHVAAVDEEVERHAEGQPVHGDDVLAPCGRRRRRRGRRPCASTRERLGSHRRRGARARPEARRAPSSGRSRRCGTCTSLTASPPERRRARLAPRAASVAAS
jgi:hypothetical protein